MKSTLWTDPHNARRLFISGSNGRIIMGDDQVALLRLWREKRGEVEPEDLSRNLVVQLGLVTPSIGSGTSAIVTSPSKTSSAGSAAPCNDRKSR
jgi:hypothetical protein